MQIILLVIEPQLMVFVVLQDAIPTLTLDSPQRDSLFQIMS